MAAEPPADPGEAELDRLAAVAVAAVVGELPPPSAEEDRVVRRVRTVVDAIRAAGDR